MLSINDRKVLLDKDSLESAIDANQLTLMWVGDMDN